MRPTSDRIAFVAILLPLVAALPAAGATFTIVNQDGAGEGFNDPTAVSPVTGNPGTTLGQQRLNVFNAAAAVWGAELKSSVAIEVGAKFDDLFCDSLGAVLGSAGAAGSAANFPNAPFTSTWYAYALADSLAVSDQDPPAVDINATFSSKLDDADPLCISGTTFWYGIGAPAPGGTVDLFPVVLHELGHGLGFASIYDKTTGALPAGFPDQYLRLIFDEETDKFWKDMTNGERLTSRINEGDLVWTGTEANAVVSKFPAAASNTSHLRLYAPATFASGSSVSHWDTTLTPDEFMEPFATANPRSYVTWRAMDDMGWVLQLVFKDGFESNNKDFWSTFSPP